jgi:hypothetical protein
MMIEEANKKELQDHQVASLAAAFETDPTRNIVDFTSGRMALEKDSLHDEQNRVRQVGRNK